MEVVELCKKYQHEGVVAIDLAGDESRNTKANPEHKEAYMVRVIDYLMCVMPVLTLGRVLVLQELNVSP